MDQLRLDFETFSEIDIRKRGLDVYCRDPSTKARLLGWKVNNEPTNMWDIFQKEPMPVRLHQLLADPEVLIYAFGARFERLILKYVLSKQMGVDFDLPIERFRCTMVLAYAMGFKGGLDDVLLQAGFADHVRKLKEGKSLIDRFSKPQSKHRKTHIYTFDNDPVGWQEFRAYCLQDVEVEYLLGNWLEQFNPMSEQEWALYALDQRINDRGAPVDLDLCKKAMNFHRYLRAQIKEDLQEKTGLGNPLANGQMRSWLMMQGHEMPNLKEETVLRKLASLEENSLAAEQSMVYDVLENYFQATRTAGTKWKAFRDRSNEDGRVRGTFQFAGASRTRRWAGRGVQLHNLRHGPPDDISAEAIKTDLPAFYSALYPAPMDTLASTIRAAITAPEGRSLVVSDLTSIESVVLGHLAGCEALEAIYRSGRDAYRVFAMNYFNTLYEEVTKDQRNFSKPPVLGCGFGLGWKGLRIYARGYGVSMSKYEAQGAVDLFRESYPEVPDMWYGLLEGIEGIINGPQGVAYERFKVRIYRDDYFLYIELPSGRRLAYYRPAWISWETPVGTRPSFTYMGQNRHTYKWERIAAHGGLITENIVQATARDILAEGMKRYDLAGGYIVAHVHDEIITEEYNETAELALETLKEVMTIQPTWLPDIWLGAGGWIGKRYRKD